MPFEEQNFQARRAFTQHQNGGGIARWGVNDFGGDFHGALN
jgi:hypothetical protein